MSTPKDSHAGVNLYDNANFRPMNYKVEYLSDQNHALWRMKLLTLWKEHGLLNVAIGKEKHPNSMLTTTGTSTTDAALSEQIDIWERKDGRASMLLLERINNTHTHLIENAETCAEKWKRIETQYLKDATLSPAYAIQAMFTHAWDSSTQSLEENLGYIQAKVNDLRKFRGDVAELMDLLHSLALIQSLPDSWSQTVNVLMLKDSLELDNVITTLKRTQRHFETENQTETALAVRAKGKGKVKGEKREKKKCDNCKRSGHTRDYCWAKGGGREGQGPASNKYGNGKSDEKTSNTKTVNLVDDDDDSDVEAAVVQVDSNSPQSKLVTMNAVSLNSAHWILDSGASTHICNDKRIMSNFRDIQPIPVRGFGKEMSVYATGKGRVTLNFAPGRNRFKIVIDNVLYVPEAHFNILSAAKLMSKGVKLIGKSDGFELYMSDELIAEAPKR